MVTAPVAGSTLWNDLPSAVTEVNSAFKMVLRTHLFHAAFKFYNIIVAAAITFYLKIRFFYLFNIF